MAGKKSTVGRPKLEGASAYDETTMEAFLLERLLPYDGPDYPDLDFHRHETKSTFLEHLSNVAPTEVWKVSAPVPAAQSDVRQMLQVLLGRFSLALRTRHLESGFEVLQSESRALHESLGSLLARDSAEVQQTMTWRAECDARLADLEAASSSAHVLSGGVISWDVAQSAVNEVALELGWDAHVTIQTEERHISVRVPPEQEDLLVDTSFDFYQGVAERVGPSFRHLSFDLDVAEWEED